MDGLLLPAFCAGHIFKKLFEYSAFYNLTSTGNLYCQKVYSVMCHEKVCVMSLMSYEYIFIHGFQAIIVGP